MLLCLRWLVLFPCCVVLFYVLVILYAYASINYHFIGWFSSHSLNTVILRGCYTESAKCFNWILWLGVVLQPVIPLRSNIASPKEYMFAYAITRLIFVEFIIVQQVPGLSLGYPNIEVRGPFQSLRTNNAIEQISFWETKSRLAGEDFSRHLGNPMLQYCFQDSSSRDTLLRKKTGSSLSCV
jgi:hypothetical protein